MPAATEVEGLLRELAPQVLGAVVRRYGHFDAAEDATQEALIAAAAQWPADGIPDSPRAWLIRVASRKLTDLLRSDHARAHREFRWQITPDAGPAPDQDDSLILLLMCCHPSLTIAAQIALTLRAVGGLSTAEIARAFLVPEDTMTRRITRAKQRVKDSGIPFAMPDGDRRAGRLATVMHVLYLIFTEGYASTRADLAGEAIRLARMMHWALPRDGEAAGLLALMLLTDARREARTGTDGEPIPMAEQDRSRWNATYIDEGTKLVTAAMRTGPPGPYQLQAAIAALHDEAATAEDTDWPQIAALYDLLVQANPGNPVVQLNHAVAVAMADGPRAGLDMLEALGSDSRITADHRFLTARAHLLEMAGQTAAAREAYHAAAGRAPTLPQQRYLHARAGRLTP
jgi:RNA polymerase sigma factor (sigma-70 family)